MSKFDKDIAYFKKVKEEFKDIKFSTKEQFFKKISFCLPGSIMSVFAGYYILHLKLDNLIVQSIQGVIPTVLFAIAGITLFSLIFNITIFDNNERVK